MEAALTDKNAAQPYFDMELFLQTTGETRLAGADRDECLSLWAQWSAKLTRASVTAEGRTYLAVWLHEDVENTIQAEWEESPSKGFRMHALAQTMTMCAVHERVPEVEDVGCAPVPPVSRALADALTEAGLPARAREGLEFARKYAVVTREPFGGGCEICALQSDCPRSGRADGSVIEFG